jgi:hypothetical protein
LSFDKPKVNLLHFWKLKKERRSQSPGAGSGTGAAGVSQGAANALFDCGTVGAIAPDFDAAVCHFGGDCDAQE